VRANCPAKPTAASIPGAKADGTAGAVGFGQAGMGLQYDIKPLFHRAGKRAGPARVKIYMQRDLFRCRGQKTLFRMKHLEIIVQAFFVGVDQLEGKAQGIVQADFP